MPFIGRYSFGVFVGLVVMDLSLYLPFFVRFLVGVSAGSVTKVFALNVDFPETFLDYAGVEVPDSMHGQSLRPVMEGNVPDEWQTSMYYRYWEHLSVEHNVGAH